MNLSALARRLRLPAAGALCLAGVPFVGAQEMPAAPVRYTVAREHPVLRTVRLPGTVESRTLSLVASEVAGLVVELPVREGRAVRQGEALARLRTTSMELRLSAAAAELKEAEARGRQAERALERARDLLQSGVASQQQFDDAFSEFTARQGRVEQLGAEMERIRFDIEHSTIRAPFAGTVVAERTEVGEWIRVGDAVAEIVSLDELEVRVEVPERHFRNLRPGTAATVSFETDPGRTLEGKVSAIIPRADPQARTFPVKVRIANRDGRIAVGMLTQVTLPAGDSYRATVVPKDAVMSQGRETIVYLLNGDSTVTRAAVETGAGVGDWIAVSGPVAAGQKVITRGNERLQPGQKVRGEPLEYDLP